MIYSSALGKDKSYFLKKKHVDFTILPFHSLLITGFVTKLAQRVQPVEQDCLPFRSTLVYPVFCGIRVTWSLVLYACFVDRCLFLCTFSFGHCVVCSFSIYGFWLLLWYLQTLPWNWYHQYAWVFDWQHAMFDGYVFNRQSAFRWIPNVLPFWLTCSFICMRQTSYRGFLWKTKRS